MEFVDPSLDDTQSSCKLMRCLQIALLCVQENQNDRPSMLEISSMLKTGSTNTVTSPKKPAFSEQSDEKKMTKSSGLISVDDATISEVVAR